MTLVDVYDALVSERAYKNPWTEEVTVDYIKNQASQLFDAEVVEAFFAIYDVIAAIKEKYQDEDAQFQNPFD